VVCLNAVFHWLPEKKGPLREFARLLRPGGRLGISSRLKGDRSRLQEIAAEVLATQISYADRSDGADPVIIDGAPLTIELERA